MYHNETSLTLQTSQNSNTPFSGGVYLATGGRIFFFGISSAAAASSSAAGTGSSSGGVVGTCSEVSLDTVMVRTVLSTFSTRGGFAKMVLARLGVEGRAELVRDFACGGLAFACDGFVEALLDLEVSRSFAGGGKAGGAGECFGAGDLLLP